MKRSPRARTRRVAEKFVKAAFAKTNKARKNYLIDVIAEELVQDQLLDSLLHLLNEVALGKGPVDKNLKTWMRKTLRYKVPRG